MIPGIIENGQVKLSRVVPAEDNTPVIVFFLPGLTDLPEINEGDSLFGKWNWFTDEMEGEIQNAWKSWKEKTDSL
jgi:hypothetical protein